MVVSFTETIRDVLVVLPEIFIQLLPRVIMIATWSRTIALEHLILPWQSDERAATPSWIINWDSAQARAYPRDYTVQFRVQRDAMRDVGSSIHVDSFVFLTSNPVMQSLQKAAPRKIINDFLSLDAAFKLCYVQQWIICPKF